MAVRLPDAASLGERPSPQPAAGVASYRPLRDNLDQVLAPAAEDIHRAGAIVEETNRRQDSIAAEAALNRLQEARVTLEFDPKAGFRNAKEGQAVGQKFVDGFMGRFNDTASAIEQSLDNQQQRALFKQRLPVVGLHYRSSLLQHQATETDRFNQATEMSTLHLLVQDAAMQPTNDIALQTNLVRMNGTIDAMAERRGLPAETAAELRTKYQDAMYAARVSSQLIGVPGVVAADPRAALAMIERTREKMQPETVLKLTHEANVAIRMLENGKRIEADRLTKMAQDAVVEARNFVETGAFPSPEYATYLRGQTAGTPYAEIADSLITQATAGAMHGSQSIPQQHEAIRAAEAVLAQKGSSPEAAQVLQRARTITAKQEAAYKENPWAAASFQRLPSAPEVRITEASQAAQIVAQRLPLMAAIETAAGPSIPVSPLQPNEAAAWAKTLKALAPADRAEQLARVSGLLSLPRAVALAEQIDKADRPLGLSLKLGMDRTTAGRTVSTLVQIGAQALADKTVKREDAALSGWRAEIAGLVRGTLGDDQAEQDVIDAAFYVRAAQDLEGSSPPGYKLKSGADEAVKLIIGQPIERGGVKTFMPRGMDERMFNDKLREFTPEVLRAAVPSGEVYVRGQPVKIELLANRLPTLGMKFASRGRYIPVAANAPVTLDKDGMQPLVLEIR